MSGSDAVAHAALLQLPLEVTLCRIKALWQIMWVAVEWNPRAYVCHFVGMDDNSDHGHLNGKHLGDVPALADMLHCAQAPASFSDRRPQPPSLAACSCAQSLTVEVGGGGRAGAAAPGGPGGLHHATPRAGGGVAEGRERGGPLRRLQQGALSPACAMSTVGEARRQAVWRPIWSCRAYTQNRGTSNAGRNWQNIDMMPRRVSRRHACGREGWSTLPSDQSHDLQASHALDSGGGGGSEPSAADLTWTTLDDVSSSGPDGDQQVLISPPLPGFEMSSSERRTCRA